MERFKEPTRCVQPEIISGGAHRLPFAPAHCFFAADQYLSSEARAVERQPAIRSVAISSGHICHGWCERGAGCFKDG